MDYRFLHAASSSRGEPSTSRPSGSGSMPFSGTSSRTSSKRSFDEYGHLESQSTSQPGPSGSSSIMTTPTSSMVGAAAMLGLGNNASIGNQFGDSENNAHNARHKRRRGSLSPPQAESSLNTPSMPAGTSLNTSGTSNHPPAGSSASNSAESLMSWSDDAAPQRILHPVNQTTMPETSPAPNGLHNATSPDLAQPAYSGDDLFEARREGDSRDNRMSWMPETSQATETVTTNTEPGWNLGPQDRNLIPSMDFPMPHAQSADALNQPPFRFERNSYDSSNETNGPRMPVPSFRPDTRSASSDFDYHTNPNATSPRSQSSLYMESWYRSHESGRVVPAPPMVPPSPDSPAPTPWRTSPPVEPPRVESSSWWPLRWNYLDGALSPPLPTAPRSTHEGRQNMTSSRPSAVHSASLLISDNVPDHRSTPAQPSRPAFPRPWEGVAPPRSPVDAPPWPPYHISGSPASPTSRTTFPEPQFPSGARRNNEYSQSRDDQYMHRARPRGFPDISPSIAPSSNTFSSFGGPPTSSASRTHEPRPPVVSSAWPSTSMYPAADRATHLRDEPASRASERIPSPPPTRQSVLALQDILDRHTRSNYQTPMLDTSTRPSHRRSASDASPIDPFHSRSPTEVQQRRGERLEEWRDAIGLGTAESRSANRFDPQMFNGTSAPRDPNSRPGARNRHPSSFYDHPSMRGLISSQSSHLQERERQELHPTIARPQFVPPPPRHALSGLLDYTRLLSGGSSAPGNPSRRANLPPTPTRAAPRSNSPVSARPFPPVSSSRRPSSPASRPSPFRLDPFSHSPPSEPSERPSESRSTSVRTRRDRRRERMGRLLGAEHPLAWLGSDEDFPFYEQFNLDERDIASLNTTAERMRRFGHFRGGRFRGVPMGRMHAIGDYVLDDDFDDSYEGLMALSQIVGPVKRGCSEDTLGGLPNGTYAEFAAGGSENNDENKVLGDNGNCAICLEDYVPTDMCTKLPRCLHFYHKDCVKEWLKTAKTCPVCRENVEGPPRVKGSSRPPRVRFVPISEAQRDAQNPALQHLRDTSGPSTSGLAPRISVPNPPRRRSANWHRPIPPPPNVFEAEPEPLFPTSGLERLRRLRVPPFDSTRIEPSMLGEFDDPWPMHSPPSPTSTFALYRGSPSPPPFREAAEGSMRFSRGPLARAFDERFNDFLPSHV